MDESELARCRELLGVRPGFSLEELEQAFMKKNFLLIRNGRGEEREKLRSAYNALAANLRAKSVQPRASRTPAAGAAVPGEPAPVVVPPPDLTPPSAGTEVSPLLAFDNWRVNALMPPLLLALMWLLNHSPLGFLLRGFQVWVHEFGHATAAWMCGWRATPLPFGWTPVEPEYSPFVYFGLLLMFGILFVAGWKERKVWPMLAAVALAGLQYYMTWRMPELRKEFWEGAFGGVGGEFYLSVLLMAFFFVELPDKFRWGACRYVFFLIGATAFLNITGFWDQVYRGFEQIPFGTMINGEEDQNGDMNKLMDLYGWSHRDIIHAYHVLGRWCWIALGGVYAVFALRLNLIPDKILGRLKNHQAAEAGSAE
jgi:hypothetical protein